MVLGFPGGSVDKKKNLPANAGDTGDLDSIHELGRFPWKEEMATHSSIFAWKISWTEEPGGLQSVGSQRVGQNLATEHSCKGSNNCLCDGKCSALAYSMTFRKNILNNEISPQSFPLPSPLSPILYLLLFQCIFSTFMITQLLRYLKR